MLMITRTQSFVELGNGDKCLLAFDAAAVDKSTLSVERAPCGRLAHVLALSFSNGEQPLRLEGKVAELAELHQVVMEVMQDTGPLHSVH